jgi:NAD-dependent SIR2 family protein deacetylase
MQASINQCSPCYQKRGRKEVVKTSHQLFAKPVITAWGQHPRFDFRMSSVTSLMVTTYFELLFLTTAAGHSMRVTVV